MTKKILILGGYGNAGRLIAELLLQEEPSIQLVIAGRDLTRAAQLANELNARSATHRVSAWAVDASNPQMLRSAFSGIHLALCADDAASACRQIVSTTKHEAFGAHFSGIPESLLQTALYYAAANRSLRQGKWDP